MFFYLAKILGFFALPSNALIVIIIPSAVPVFAFPASSPINAYETP